MRSGHQPKRDREETFELAVGCSLALLGAAVGLGFWVVVLWLAARLIGVPATTAQIVGVALVVSATTSTWVARR